MAVSEYDQSMYWIISIWGAIDWLFEVETERKKGVEEIGRLNCGSERERETEKDSFIYPHSLQKAKPKMSIVNELTAFIACLNNFAYTNSYFEIN